MSKSYGPMRITSKGQVTIPGEVRAELGLLPQTEVEFEVREGEAVIRKAGTGRGKPERPRGRAIVDHLVRHGREHWKKGLTAEEVLRMTRGDHADEGQ